MGFDVQIAYSVEEIGQEAWDHLGAGRPFMGYRWYRFGELVLQGDLPIYIILSRGGEPVARGTCWLTRQEPIPISSRWARAFVQALVQRRPLMICRSPLTSTSGLLCSDPSLWGEALESISETALALAREHKASFLMFDYLEEEQASRPGWPEGLTMATMPDPGTRLVIVWPDFEGYLHHLSKSMRKDYRRHRNRATDLGLVVQRHERALRTDEALALIRNVSEHHGSEPNPRARAIWEKAGLVDATWLTTEIQDRLVGCGLVLSDGDTCFLALLGLDYSLRYVYFQLVYEAIGAAIDCGARVLRGGGGAYPMKRRLGFQVENDNFVVFSGSGRLFQRLGRWLAPTAGAEAMRAADEG